MTYRVTAPAEADLVGIARYTRRQWGPERVTPYVEGLFQTFERLSQTPEVGLARDDLRPGLRIALHRRDYYVCYRISGDEVHVLRVVHTRRDLAQQIRALRPASGLPLADASG